MIYTYTIMAMPSCQPPATPKPGRTGVKAAVPHDVRTRPIKSTRASRARPRATRIMPKGCHNNENDPSHFDPEPLP